MARYGLFVLKVSLNPNQPTNLTTVPDPHSGGPPFWASGLGLGFGLELGSGLGLTLADHRNGGPPEWRTGILTMIDDDCDDVNSVLYVCVLYVCVLYSAVLLLVTSSFCLAMLTSQPTMWSVTFYYV